MAEETEGKRRGWLTILLSVLALIALAFAAYALLANWRSSRSDDARRVRDLAIAADNISKWPEVARQIGRSNLYHKGENGGRREVTAERSLVWLHHPDLGEFQVEYLIPAQAPTAAGGATTPDSAAEAAMCGKPVEIEDDEMTVEGLAMAGESPGDGAYDRRMRAGSWFRPAAAAGRPVCFRIERLKLREVTAVPKGFDHLLLAEVTSDRTGPVAASVGGPVVAQIGDGSLPIRDLKELPDLRPQLLNVADTFARAASGAKPADKQEAKAARGDALEPLNSAVAGTGYRFYFYPVTLEGEKRNYLLVGTVRDGVRAGPLGWLGPRALAFVLALLFLAALTPTIKLALVGPVDGIKRIEAGALVFGLLAAAAFATAALVVTADVIGVRKTASERLGRSAAALATRSATELRRVLLGEDGSAMAELSRLMADARRAGADDVSQPLILRIGRRAHGLRDFLQPDSLFPIARDGRIAEGMSLTTSRDMSGAAYELADRPYFRRAVNGDFAPGSEELVEEMKGRTPDLWGCARGGMVFDQVRSRPDGVPKTIMAAPVAADCLRSGDARPADPPPAETSPDAREPSAAPADDPDGGRRTVRVLGVSTVLKSLLSPPLHDREQFAVLDASEGSGRLPVLVHSEPGRANFERFAEGLNGPARDGFAKAAAKRPACQPGAPRVDAGQVERFSGTYEGTSTLFAAVRLPCTDWIVATFIARDLVDGFAAQPAVHAVEFWMGGLLLMAAVLAAAGIIKRAADGRAAWLWLWPDPDKRHGYRQAIRPLALATAILAVATLFLPRPFWAALLGPPLAAAVLFPYLSRKDRRRSLPSWLAPPIRSGDRPDRPVLDRAMERDCWIITLLAVLCISVLPLVGLARDARAYFDAQQIGRDFAAFRDAREQEVRKVEAVALTYREDARAVPAPDRPMVPLLCGDREGDRLSFGLAADSGPCFGTGLASSPPPSFTAAMRRTTLGMDGQTIWGADARIERPGWDWGSRFLLAGLTALLGGMLLLAFRSALKGLFGFGVVLEAVPYPGLPTAPAGAAGADATVDLGQLPPRFIAVATPDAARRELLKLADDNRVDLFSATGKDAKAVSYPAATPRAHPPLMLFENLELLMRNRERRLDALAILEQAVAEQGRGSGVHAFTLGLVTDLSPLDRLLQSYERDAEELERLTPQQRHGRRAELAGEREDVRWSRLFEGFTTYTYRAVKRDPVPGATLADDERTAVRVVEQETAYLPDHVVAAVIPDAEPPLKPKEIADWARKTLKDSSPRAIVDYLSSQLIEHYQLAWSVSSHAERLLLHRLAHGQFVNIGEAYALRSLVRRGLVVLDPVPRVMSDSFAQFVRHAEEPTTLARWRGETQRSAWQAVRNPLMVALPFALGVIAFVAIRSGESLAALLPFIASVGPALINFLSGHRRAGA